MGSRLTDGRKIAPGSVDPESAQRALARVRDVLANTLPNSAVEIEVRGEHGGDEVLVLPRPTVLMFADILAVLARGQGVQLMPLNAELTTQQAADMMNVSRPYLIGLLERQEIPYRLVGRHRRIRYADLIAYLEADEVKRRAAIDELTTLDQELGTDD
jgi:excisionase family DNA binding protein